MESHIISCLTSTYTNPSTAKEAEAELTRLSSDPSFLPALFVVVTSQSDSLIIQSGSIYLKNKILRDYDENKIPDPASLKSGLLHALATLTIPQARTQILTAISHVLSVDHQENKWPEYLPAISNLISSQVPNTVYAGLLGLLELVKNYQWVMVGKRQVMHQMVQHGFPTLLSLANNALVSNTPEAYEMLHIIVKTYFCSIRMELAKQHQEEGTLLAWITLFISIIQKPCPPEYQSESHPFWKTKKWAMRCIDTLFGRYACSLKKDKRFSQFALIFTTQFAPKIVQVYIDHISQLVNGSLWMSSRCKQLLSSFLEDAIKPKATWTVLKSHLELLITRFIFPQLCFSQEDEELWDEDAVEYVQRKVDTVIDDYKSPVTAAQKLLQRIVTDRPKQTFQATVTFIYHLFEAYMSQPAEARNPREKYAALKMIVAIKDDVMAPESPVKAQLESFLVTHVFPELSSQVGYIRVMALETAREFADVEYANAAHLQYLVERTLHLIKDQDLPVRVAAPLTLSPLLHLEQVKQAVRPHVTGIMQELLNLTNEIDMDLLTHVMEQLVFQFSDELTPFAVQLASQLRDTFLRIMGDENQEMEAEEAEDRSMAAMGICKTISSLILAVEASPQIVLQIEAAVAPVLELVLRGCILDLYEEVFEIIESSTFCAKTISPVAWTLFPYIYTNFKTDALDYIEEVLPTLDNMIMYGKDAIASNPALQMQFVDMAMTVLSQEDDSIGESDRCRACQLLESLMLNLRGAIDAHIPRFIEIAYNFLNKKIKTPAFKVHALEIVVNALYYNPQLTLSLLDQAQWTVPFFQLWMSSLSNFVRVHDKKLSILALMTVLRLPQDSLPASIRELWTQFFMGILKVFETYQDALEERKHQEDLGAGGSDDEDDLEVEDDDDDDFSHQSHTQGTDGDVSDEDDDYLEVLAQKAAQHNPDQEDDDDGSDFSELDFDDLLYEDVFFTTVLDDLDAYVEFEKLMGHISNVGGNALAVIESSLSEEQRRQVVELLNKAKEAQSSK